MKKMCEMYKSLMEGLKEDLQDMQLAGTFTKK